MTVFDSMIGAGADYRNAKVTYTRPGLSLSQLISEGTYKLVRRVEQTLHLR